MQNPDDRTRAHPEERFAPSTLIFDFNNAADELAREPSATTQHHRQKTLYRHGQTSLSLFLFEAGSELREHRAEGTVLIQLLDGRIIINAQGIRHEMKSGQVLVMSPGVPHDLLAEVAARVLLTVCLESKPEKSKSPTQ
jgi:quercetin dioxygenase-like cupin family protein